MISKSFKLIHSDLDQFRLVAPSCTHFIYVVFFLFISVMYWVVLRALDIRWDRNGFIFTHFIKFHLIQSDLINTLHSCPFFVCVEWCRATFVFAVLCQIVLRELKSVEVCTSKAYFDWLVVSLSFELDFSMCVDALWLVSQFDLVRLLKLIFY